MRRFLSVLFVVVTCICYSQDAVPASVISVPYSMGFEPEDAVEMSDWVLNPGANASSCTDQWCVGNAVKSDGKQSLYISSDGGASAVFGIAQNVQYAYRDFVLPKGVYEVSFDWACLGTNEAVLYAGVAPAANISLQANDKSAVVPNGVLSWCKTLGKMNGTTLWKNASMSLSSNGTSTYRLFFAWSSSNKDTTLAIPMGACIDNIQICSANCAKPTKIEVDATCDTLWIAWKGTSEKYSLEYRRRGKKWSVPTIYYTESCVITGVEEGLYDFRVRGICNGVDTSSYTYLSSVPLFCPENHCLNYVALDDSVNVVCSYGTFGNPEANEGVQDFGAENKYSRHTVNWEPDVYDPRTCNQLPTIPDGELASVRLGNWNNGAEGEAISYTYVADIENAAIMLLKYAIVLEDPGHGEKDNPQFSLEILDEDGDLLSPTCGAANFSADANRQGDGWHVCSSAPGSSSAISWKEWTTIGLNLAELGVKTGDVLTIKLTTKDCNWSAHYGYAYFTLGCAAAKIYGTSCGNDAQLSVAAPEGFLYEWYNKYDSLVATTRDLSVDPSDTTTYRCRLIFAENSECEFNLYTSIYPRFPVAEFDYSYEPTNCQNRVVFKNKSHILTVFDGDTVHRYDEKCEDFEWRFGTGEESGAKDPVHIFPNEGGTFPVSLFSSISDGSCIGDTTVYITIPAIGDYVQVIDSTICQGDYVVFGKYYAAEERLYYDSLKTIAGCDSVIILDLKVNPVSKTILPDTTVCAEEPLCIDGECYKHKTSGEFVRFLKNQYGCDSTVWIHVNMLDSILPTVELQSPTDDGELGSVSVSGTGYDYYYFNGVKYDASNTYHGDLEGGIMEFQFFNDFGCSVEIIDTMNCECVAISLLDILPVCVGANQFDLSYVVDSGFPTTYSLLFDSVARSCGFVDITKMAIDRTVNELYISIPQTVIPGKYQAQLIFHNLLKKCQDPVFDLALTVNFSADLIFQRWNDVLSVVATPEYNYGFRFDDFQWVKNGEKIAGANLSYYYEAGGLDPSAEYQVEVLLPNGVRLTTCPFVPVPYNTPELQTQKIIENQRLIIIRNNVRYNAQGQMIQAITE